MLTLRSISSALLLGCLPASAQLIGSEDFTYPDGPIAGQTGGTGWNWDNINDVTTVTGIQVGQTVHLRSSPDLQTWTPIPGTELTVDSVVPVKGTNGQVFKC